MKRKTITLVVYMLVCISLVSVGFAAWVITGGDQINDATGNVSASAVSDESVTLTRLGWDVTKEDGEDAVYADNGKIHFGPKSKNSTSGWLQSDSESDIEDLSSTFYFSVSTEGNSLSDAIARLGTLSLGIVEGSGITAAQGNALIGGYSISFKVQADEFTSEPASLTPYASANGKTAEVVFKEAFNSFSSTSTAYVAVKITYTWGTIFGEKSPFDFYNAQGVEPGADSGVVNPESAEGANFKYKEHAAYYLNLLNEKLASDNNITLTINFATAS